MKMPAANQKAVKRFVWTVSIAIPLVVLALFLIPPAEGLSDETLKKVYWLPRFNALLNASAFTCLLFSLFSIRKGEIAKHRNLNTAALSLSALFLVSYVIFHLLTQSTKFGGQGPIRVVYLSILITHILLSVAIVVLLVVA